MGMKIPNMDMKIPNMNIPNMGMKFIIFLKCLLVYNYKSVRFLLAFIIDKWFPQGYSSTIMREE